MPRSMTGFGRAETVTGNNKFTVEINTFNNRFLDYQMRIPKTLASLENEIKNLLNSKFSRGKIIITITWDHEQTADSIVLDEEKADAYFRIFDLLKKKYSLHGEISMENFATLPDLVKIEREEDDLEKIWNDLKSALLSAADAAVAMRISEGNRLVQDLSKRLSTIRALTDEIEKLASSNVDLYREKLKSRISELLGDSPVDEQRLATEIALFAEKSDITEECIRLKSHLVQFEESLKEDLPIGKRLNFILQELNREANTAGSKSAAYEISRRVIEIKEEIERLREQVQNIE